MAFLKPEENAYVEGAAEHNRTIDLASFGANKATDYFIIKFLMCNELN